MQECRLIYRSVSTDDFVCNETLSDITEKGAENNRKKGITGLLILTGNEFLQVLEGPLEAVNHLYLTIAKDPRHTKINLMSFELISSRFFETWNMRLIDLWDLPGPTRAYLLSKYPHDDEVIRIPSTFIEIHSLLLDARSFCLSTPWK
jgi:hypothetical protein